MNLTATKTDGSPIPAPSNEGTGTANNSESSDEIKVCPDCGGNLVYGSHDPCEGFAFWCDRCGFGPVWVDNPRAVLKPAGRVIDADTARAAAGIQGRAAAIQGTVFADRAPFDPAGFIEDVIGS